MYFFSIDCHKIKLNTFKINIVYYYNSFFFFFFIHYFYTIIFTLPFLDMSSAIGAVRLRETRKLFAAFNTLDDTKTFLSKEVSLLNSIYENFPKAMQSAGLTFFILYIYICVCVSMCAYAFIHTPIHLYIHTYIYIYIYMCVCMCLLFIMCFIL